MRLGLYASLFLVAVGGAMFVGTATALVAYRRTGSFPGQPAVDDRGRPVVPSVGTAVAKVALGAVLLAAGVAGLVLGEGIG